MPTLSARSIKVTLVLDPLEVADVLQLTVAVADPRVPFAIDVEGRRLRCIFAAKSVRKCMALLHAQGPGNVAVIVQGKLMRDDTLAEAGLVAQVKVRPPEPAAEA
jgi:hypothetical protein